ncbi:hypothetical protein PVAP13_5NG076600 [Panicum virgatum]|uniref:Uncharacterized protein n=1 Tax=Panicum virgatum TaxID=38727 RepID=A0A8T0RQF3_PANVG|nr:hypothetical protein PVAP13_5NG076600 [Panicum virgatum]
MRAFWNFPRRSMADSVRRGARPPSGGRLFLADPSLKDLRSRLRFLSPLLPLSILSLSLLSLQQRRSSADGSSGPREGEQCGAEEGGGAGSSAAAVARRMAAAPTTEKGAGGDGAGSSAGRGRGRWHGAEEGGSAEDGGQQLRAEDEQRCSCATNRRPPPPPPAVRAGDGASAQIRRGRSTFFLLPISKTLPVAAAFYIWCT